MELALRDGERPRESEISPGTREQRRSSGHTGELEWPWEFGQRAVRLSWPRRLCCADLLCLLFLAYAAYFLAACILDFQRALALFIITCLVILVLALHFLKKFFGGKLSSCLEPLKNSRLRFWMKW